MAIFDASICPNYKLPFAPPPPFTWGLTITYAFGHERIMAFLTGRHFFVSDLFYANMGVPRVAIPPYCHYFLPDTTTLPCSVFWYHHCRYSFVTPSYTLFLYWGGSDDLPFCFLTQYFADSHDTSIIVPQIYSHNSAQNSANATDCHTKKEPSYHLPPPNGPRRHIAILEPWNARNVWRFW